MPQLDITRHGRVAVLTLDRPQHGNRVSQQMAVEMTAALDAARKDSAIGACVLTGRGDVFCLGGDYQGAGPTTAGRLEYARAFMDMHHAMARVGKPLVAAVNGNAHAGGFSILVACDLAVAAEDATFGLPEASYGLFPFLALAAVKDALPKKLLFDIVYNARLMSAQEARDNHIVNWLEPRPRVLERAIAAAEAASARNADILMLGRDLYYGMRGASSAEALDQSRFALGAALAA
ncbi:MAG TPA: enoyl-CoA hydratase/isomerase family protein, partial [Dongiaceae bacterium]|nr:enoyl-CoA hydratase/isomerase family protein [Dongiaceae bacterium]